jgi:hypothetical protein
MTFSIAHLHDESTHSLRSVKTLQIQESFSSFRLTDELK